MYPLCYTPLSPYCAMIASGSSFSDNLIYSYLSIGVPQYKYFMSQHRKLAPFVDMVIYKRIIYVFISAVLVLTSPGKMIRSPPCHNSCLVRFILLESAIAKKLAVGDVLSPICCYSFMFQEKYGVVNIYSVFHPLC